MKSALILALLWPLAVVAQIPGRQDTLTMDKVINEVISHNDRFTASRFMEKSASDKIGPAGAWDDPMLMLGIQNAPLSFDLDKEDMTMQMIGISQKIPYAGEKGKQKKAAQADFLAAREQTRGTVSELVKMTKFAYVGLYYNRQALKYIQSQRDIQDDIVSSAISRLGSDRASQADVAAAQADLWRIEADLLEAQQDIETAENELSAMMGRNPNSKLPELAEPRFAVFSRPFDSWLASARETYPPFLELERQKESYHFSALAARGMRYPMLSLSASYGLRMDAPVNASSMGKERSDMISLRADISIPIFEGRQKGKMASSMAAMSQSTEAQASQLWLDVQARLKTLYERGQQLTKSLELYNTRIVPADDDAFKSGFAAYTSNRLLLSTLLDYAFAIYRDRLVSNRLAATFAKTAAEAELYITNPDIWVTQ